ncbi:hypothetical protein MHH33_06320 [Paenisporosarcina sp. FSL H8-0542]|uniref:hypothetical protein n=1 Tax=unclassified Paenisporosarcina TaxID=2642018 RepID=UPI00034E2876|nr:hypothetical protein [Paenisporosarcina sp. HGH0030]EPD54107.1 hypothetical protein HMPREF1210_00092 [Paenisporosarcina sp. HGH0030]
MKDHFEETGSLGQTTDDLNKNPSFSSPTSAVSEEETRILSEYIAQKNLFKVTSQDESRRKVLFLKQFFKMKRNQQVVVSSVIEKDIPLTTEGKVATIGRDFVMLTDLKKRLWIPYRAIQSATIPFGFPTYSNTHQHFIYDNNLQQKLVLQFGETVAKKDVLIRQFFEESLQTNLHSWKGIWVETRTADNIFFGKIASATKADLILQLSKKKESVIPLNEIRFVSTIGIISLWKKVLKLWLEKD